MGRKLGHSCSSEINLEAFLTFIIEAEPTPYSYKNAQIIKTSVRNPTIGIQKSSISFGGRCKLCDAAIAIPGLNPTPSPFK